MSAHPQVRFTVHARKRCAEMGVTLERVEEIVRRPTMTWAAESAEHPPGRMFAWRSDDPGVGVYYSTDAHGVRVAITVVPRTYETYYREPSNETNQAEQQRVIDVRDPVDERSEPPRH